MKKYITLIIIPTFLIISNVLKDNIRLPALNISREERSLNFNQSLVNIFSVGQKRLVSSLFWIHTMLESDIERVRDGNSWMYYRFKTISSLDPFFYQNYLYGGLYLSIIKDDVIGAADIYNLGLQEYKNDFWLNYNSAFNDYFELGNKESALRKYKVALNSPEAKPHSRYLPGLISRIQAETGGLEEAFTLLLNHYNNTPRGKLKDRLKDNLYSLKAEIDLNCLNDQKENCQSVDLDGNKYIKIDNKFRAVKVWKKYRPSKRKRKE